MPRQKALVVVLGELARSPRMQYHCMSLAANNYDVTVIANGQYCTELESDNPIKQALMPDTIDFKRLNYLPSILAYILKPIWQSILLIYQLFFISANVIILQNPPSIPALPIIFLYSKLVGAKLIIDWHNYGFTILSLNLRPDHAFVRVCKSIELYFGRLADAGFCVSESMKKDLIENFNIPYDIHVLYDKPPKHFKPLNLREKHNFYIKAKDQIEAFRSPTDDDLKRSSSFSQQLEGRRETRFTMTDVINKNVIMSKPNRPAIMMSSTSWTEDEDFGLLLEALKLYDRARSEQLHADYPNPEDIKLCLPDLVCVITGKGPLKSYYQDKIAECKFEHINIVLPWLSAADYAKMVASSDLGISLHSSSSGVDLPMKVVDMFGCGIPVLAYNYSSTINELVVEDFYGLTFKNSSDLFTKLAFLLKNFHVEDVNSRDSVECSPLARFRKNIKRRFLLTRWEDNWNREAKPIFDALSVASTSSARQYQQHRGQTPTKQTPIATAAGERKST